MALAVTCGSCNTTFRVKDEHAGKHSKCPRCQAAIEIPAKEASEKKTGAPIFRQSEGASANLDIREILQAFQGKIEPIPRTARYRVGILILTFAMLLLPVLYLGFIAGVVYLLYLHATVNVTAISQMRSCYATVFLYVGPLVAAPTLL